MPNTTAKRCAQCGTDLGELPPDAPHKKFCSVECRVKFWRQARKVGGAVLHAANEEAAKADAA